MKPRAIAALAARLIVGAVFVYAGFSKLSAPAEEFSYVIQAYDVIPPSMALPLAGLLPWLELLVGWALVLGVNTAAASLAAGAMLATFLAALAAVVLRGIPIPNCGCFGSALHFTPVQAFAVDATMTALCWLAFKSEPGPASLDSWSQRGL